MTKRDFSSVCARIRNPLDYICLARFDFIRDCCYVIFISGGSFDIDSGFCWTNWLFFLYWIKIDTSSRSAVVVAAGTCDCCCKALSYYKAYCIYSLDCGGRLYSNCSVVVSGREISNGIWKDVGIWILGSRKLCAIMNLELCTVVFIEIYIYGRVLWNCSA